MSTRIVRDMQWLVDENDDLVGYRKNDSTEVQIGTGARPEGAAAVVGASGGQNSVVTFADALKTNFPDEVVRLTGNGSPCASAGCYISRIRCITGTSVALTVYDNAAASSGTTLYSGTLSEGEEAAITSPIYAINGLRAVFASGSFDFYVGQEVA